MHERRKLPRWQINQQGALKLEQELFCQVKDMKIAEIF